MFVQRRSTYLVVLFIGLANTAVPAQRGRGQDVQFLHSCELLLGIGKIAATNCATYLNNQKQYDESGNELVSGQCSQGVKACYLLANILGLARNGVALGNATLLDPLAKNPGNLFALSSSTMTLLIDSYLHVKNMIQKQPYAEVSQTNSVLVRFLQVLEFGAACLAQYGRTPALQTVEFQTSMHNVQAAIEALEKMILSGAYTTEAETAVVTALLGGVVGLNALSAGYYGLQAAQKDTTTLIVPNGDGAIRCSDGRCGMAANLQHMVRLGTCQHEVCVDCVLRGGRRDNVDRHGHVKINCPCCTRTSSVEMAPLQRIVNARIDWDVPGDLQALMDFFRVGIPGAVPAGDDGWEMPPAGWEGYDAQPDNGAPGRKVGDADREEAAAFINPARIVRAPAAGIAVAQRKQWYRDNRGAGEIDDLNCAICTDVNDDLADRQMVRLDCGHMFCLGCCAEDTIRRQEANDYECAVCRGHCDLHAAN